MSPDDMTDQDWNDQAALREVFVAEAESQLAVLEEMLLELESSPSDPEVLSTVFRAAHTIKGGALLVELDGVGRLAHCLEDVLEDLRSGTRAVESQVVSLLLRGVDALRTLMGEVAEGGDPPVAPYEELCAALAGWTGAAPETALDAEPEATPVEHDAEGGAVAGDSPQEPEDEGGAAERPRSARGRRTLRVEIEKLDRLLEAVGELAIERQTFAARLAGNVSGAATAPKLLLESFLDGERFLDELRDAVLSMRLVPLGPQFRRFGRAVRDAALAGGKEAALRVEGESVELDMSIAEQIVEPLTHLIRNAVDHGIEAPGDRERAGKPRQGTVTVRARRDAGCVVIEVSDDGAGLSRAALEGKAREWGVANPQAMADADLRELVFQPGFSTADSVTDLSGRGVGMDSVRSTVEGLRGSVEMQSEEGAGTTVLLSVPLTLATIRGLEVMAGGNACILPMESVEECAISSPHPGAPGELISHGGRAMPFLDLRARFGGADVHGPPEQLIIVRHGKQVAGLAVDEVRGEIETVMRPMAQPLDRIAGVGGSALLPDGRIGLIVDVPGLLRDANRSETRAVPA